MKRLIPVILLLLSCMAAAQTITVVSGNSYDSINPTARTYGIWYNAALNPAAMPIAVFIHGGAWSGGGGEAYNYPPITPSSCNGVNANAVACGLASLGYAVYSIDYTLATTDPATKWPVQWQDCECFFKFLAEDAGTTSLPGNPQAIYLFGHSAGAHLAGMVALAPHDKFPTNCGHTSTNYTIKAVALLSPPLDLRQLWLGAQSLGIAGSITNLLGCVPQALTSAACIQEAAAATPNTFATNASVPTMEETGQGDLNIPYTLQGSLQSVFAGLNPPVNMEWDVLPKTFAHHLDLYYFNPCSADTQPGSEPSPCGTAGRAYKDMVTFFTANP